VLDFIFVNIMVIFVLKNGKIVKSIVLMRVIVQCFVRGYAVRVNIKKTDKYVPLRSGKRSLSSY